MTQIWAKTALLPEGWADDVVLELAPDGRIRSVAADQPATGQQVGILLPAPANVHSHAFQRAMAGMTEAQGPAGADSFWTWRRLMYRFLDQLTPDDIEAIAALVQIEMLEAGYAAVGEFHYLHHQPGGHHYESIAELSQRIINASAVTGIGLTLLPVFYQHGGCDGRALESGQQRFGTDIDSFARLFDEASIALRLLPTDSAIGVAPHSLRAVSPAGLAEVLTLSGERPVHIHVAEQRAEVEEIVAAWGARPVEWLLANHPVGANYCLIHCTQMTDHETTALAVTGATAGLCPITESSLGDGIVNATRFLADGGRIAVGSDSNIRISLSEELRTLEYSQRLRDRSRAALATAEQSTGRRLFDAVSQNGGRAIGRLSGGLAVGEWADLLALDADAITLAEKTGDQLLDSFIFASDDRLVKEVWSAGRHLVKQGRHIGRAAIEKRYRATLAGLSERL